MTGSAPSPLSLELTWQGEMRFAGHAGPAEMVLDGAGQAGPSPVQALAFGLAACMAIDVLQILTKGRYVVEVLGVRLVGERRAEEPRIFVKFDLHFVVTGAIPAAPVERAIALSREKYCTVWHSLRPDIHLSTSFEILSQG